MRKFFALLSILLLLSLAACGGSREDPVTSAAPGLTKEETIEKEPTLSDYDENQLSCDKSYADTQGTLLVSFCSAEGTDTVESIRWIAEPADGTGKETYDALFAALKKCYGKPAMKKDRENVEGALGSCYDEAAARWDFDEYSVSCSYYCSQVNGKCQIIYNRSIAADALLQ